MLREGGIVDASIVSAPSSTKNESGKHAPAKHQFRKGNLWYFGMKVQIGFDGAFGQIYSIYTTSANLHDIVPVGNPRQCDEFRVFGDTVYLEIQKGDDNNVCGNLSLFIAKHLYSRKNWTTVN